MLVVTICVEDLDEDVDLVQIDLQAEFLLVFFNEFLERLSVRESLLFDFRVDDFDVVE